MKTSTTRRRVSLAAVLAVLALTFTACGAEGGDDAKSTTTTTAASNDDTTTTTTEADDTPTTESDDTTTSEPGGPSTSGNIRGMAKDVLIDTYKKMGMTQKQAECAADFLVDKMGDLSGLDDMSALTELGKDMAKKCDIDPTDLKPSGN